VPKKPPELIIEDDKNGSSRSIKLRYALNKPKKSGDNKKVSVERIVKSITTGLMEDERRPRRRKDQLVDPEKTADSDVNRLDKHFQSRIDESTDKNIRDFLRATGMSKKEATERAFTLLIELYDYDPE